MIQRKVKAVGNDYPPDYCVRTMTFEPQKKLTREDNTTHQAFFPVGITVVEYLTNLDRIGAPRCRFVALPLPVEGADGSPVRAVAMVDYRQERAETERRLIRSVRVSTSPAGELVLRKQT